MYKSCKFGWLKDMNRTYFGIKYIHIIILIYFYC